MKVLLHFPDWQNRWIDYIKKELSCYDLTVLNTMETKPIAEAAYENDVLISMWANDVTKFWSEYFPNKKIISYLRRYEMYDGEVIKKINWNNVDALIFVNRWFMDAFRKQEKNGSPKNIYCIPNGIDLDQFNLNGAQRDGKKVAMVCQFRAIKNFGLAAQVLMLLPDDYTLHYIGLQMGQAGAPPYHPEFLTYLMSLGLSKRWVWYKPIPRNAMPGWYADKDFILSTSINEGNPNNVIEGMACGLLPVVHKWPGADDQFPPYNIFTTAREAADIITCGDIENITSPELSRSWVERHYSLENFKKIHEVINEVMK